MRSSLRVAGVRVALAAAFVVVPALAVPPPAPAEAESDGGDASDAVATAMPAAPAAPVSLDAVLPEPLAGLLPSLPEPDAMRLRRHAIQWQGWSPQARAGFAGRVAAWDALDPAERARRREAWQAWQALPGDQRAIVIEAAREFARRPEAGQAAAWRRFAAQGPERQRGWLLGPALGADYPSLQPLLAQVPAGQRRPLLTVLWSMTADQRRQLGVLVQRTPPQARDALRLELIATPPERRPHWLRERLGR